MVTARVSVLSPLDNQAHSRNFKPGLLNAGNLRRIKVGWLGPRRQEGGQGMEGDGGDRLFPPLLCILPPELRPTCWGPGDNTQAYGPHPCTASQNHPHLSHVQNEQHPVSCPGPLKRVVWLRGGTCKVASVVFNSV